MSARYRVVYCTRCWWVYPGNAAGVELVVCARGHRGYLSLAEENDPQHLAGWALARLCYVPVWLKHVLREPLAQRARDAHEPEPGRTIDAPSLGSEPDDQRAHGEEP